MEEQPGINIQRQQDATRIDRCAFIFKYSLNAMRQEGEDEEIVVTFATILLHNVLGERDDIGELAAAMEAMTPGGSA